MRTECRDALSALCDGEMVDPELVREALGDPHATSLLVALAETRAELLSDAAEPSPAMDRRITAEFERLQPAGLDAVLRRFGAGGARGILAGAAAGLVAGWLLTSIPSSPPLALVAPSPPPLFARAAPPVAPEAARVAVGAVDRTAPARAAGQAPDRAAPVASRVVTFAGDGTWTEGDTPRDGEVRR